MAYGKTFNAGTPPPIVLLNGYGDYVFKNVPVVIINFSVDLPTDVDYIHVQKQIHMLLQEAQLQYKQFQHTPRREVHNFSLDTFVKGGYAKGRGGFI